jgi:hypothetical protein
MFYVNHDPMEYFREPGQVSRGGGAAIWQVWQRGVIGGEALCELYSWSWDRAASGWDDLTAPRAQRTTQGVVRTISDAGAREAEFRVFARAMAWAACVELATYALFAAFISSASGGAAALRGVRCLHHNVVAGAVLAAGLAASVGTYCAGDVSSAARDVAHQVCAGAFTACSLISLPLLGLVLSYAHRAGLLTFSLRGAAGAFWFAWVASLVALCVFLFSPLLSSAQAVGELVLVFLIISQLVIVAFPLRRFSWELTLTAGSPAAAPAAPSPPQPPEQLPRPQLAAL